MGEFALVHVEVNAHMYYGAAEVITENSAQAFFATRRLELRVVAPGAFGSKDLYKWRLVVAPLSAEVIPEDCKLELQETTGRFGSKRLTISLMKAKKRRWH